MTYRYCLGISVSEEQLSAIKVVIQVEDGAVRQRDVCHSVVKGTCCVRIRLKSEHKCTHSHLIITVCYYTVM